MRGTILCGPGDIRSETRDDPTIMAWELMNEGNAQPEALRLAWTAEMSAYIKSVDPNHLVSSGHANIAAKPSDRLSDLTI